MATSDIVAVGLLVLCVLLGMRGCFRWLPGAVLGLIVGFMILVAIGMVSSRPWSGQVGSFFSEGSIVPSVGRQVKRLAERTRTERESLSATKFQLQEAHGQDGRP